MSEHGLIRNFRQLGLEIVKRRGQRGDTRLSGFEGCQALVPMLAVQDLGPEFITAWIRSRPHSVRSRCVAGIPSCVYAGFEWNGNRRDPGHSWIDDRRKGPCASAGT